MKSHGRNKITGDVVGAVTMIVAGKEGRFAVNLRKAIVDKLGIRRNHVSGAMLNFDGGESVFLLSGDTVASKLVVKKTSPGRIEIAVGVPADVEVDEVEATFLSMKAAAFGRGDLNLTRPLSSSDWHQTFGNLIASVSREAEAARLAHLEEL